MPRTREENAADLEHEARTAGYPSYTFQLHIEVTDEEALYARALDRAITEDGLERDDAINTLRPDGEIDVTACIQMLADPGVSWPGTEIQESSCE